ncbi:hypothetical protein HYPSUDRAFT_45789 [Hypholoma sublateritium FD-334 SS-4]|uniref:Uncharacterized protein n=1 Tax=Hypholoma sublateritium (strain FD-334 SS-4) TaxID=945553 RepID=A0A0D2KTI7_HYPSF|nr:hypothetical protein HYPSUDRAFT_45789 [Hypholoma sublateritium FD-334 SS-4]
MSREQIFVDSGPRNSFHQGEIYKSIICDLHTGSEYSTSSGTVTARQNTERDTIGQSERPSASEGMEEMEVWKGKQRADAPSPPSGPPLEEAVAREEPPTGSIRRWKEPKVSNPRESTDYPLGSSRHKGFTIQLCDPSVPTERQKYFGRGRQAG